MIISISFFLFLVINVLLYWIIPIQKIRIYLLSASSLLFIGFNDLNSALLVILLTIYSYTFAYLISTTKNNKALFHRIGIIGLVVVLIVFKYLGLLSRTLNDITYFFAKLPDVKFESLLIPLGISYIVFKLISYLTDVYWGVTVKGNFLDLLCYTSLFTIYTAGPIERFERFEPQISKKITFSKAYIESGTARIIYGLFKKLVIADWIGYFTSGIWQNQSDYSFGFRVIALLGFSIQIYTDFAGYSDIAIGSSQLFGIKIMENFDRPYFQRNITEFWKHWHISLSEWIRDYLFFPLSSFSSNKIWSLFLVPIIAMALCGLWHGSAWHFMIWGIWHGFGISILQIWHYYRRKTGIRGLSKSVLTRTAYTILTFTYVTVGWAWFR